MKELDLSMAQFSAFGSFLNVGGAVGALFSGQLAVILGRRRVIAILPYFLNHTTSN
jgi:MFS-type transporter involved in bile tolerance (Atg22 family)